jgi:hypothetical protein
MSSLTATNVKLDADKLELAKLKGCNVSQLCRDAIDSYLRLSGENSNMLKDQLAEIEQQIKTLNLEKKIILKQLETFESLEAIELKRENLFSKWKGNLAFMIKHNTIDWYTQKDLFKFTNIEDCKKWIIGRLLNEGLVDVSSQKIKS